MTRQYELVERVLSYQPTADEALLNRAYVYAMKAHGNQKRASGAPYFSHPLEVAAILAEMRLDDATIATALLHDTIEDTGTTRSEIDALFGREIGTLVDGLTKIKKLDLVTKKAEQAENFRKLLLAISSDIRVLLVKLADRLHNMRTIWAMKPDKRKLVAEETMEIYAPLAGRMGMQWLREELEDHAFKALHPQAYVTVVERLATLRERNQGLINEIAAALTAKRKEAKVAGFVAGREKKPFAIWSKMERKQISLEQLSDIYAFRIVVPAVEDCYRALAVVHTSWHAVPGRFKDYISNPKQNDYQSIHTTIVGPRHQRVELQIRTERMHSVAEYGVAAHALYKDLNGTQGRAGAPSQDSNAYRWLRHLVGMLLDGDNPEEFLEHTKLELFKDQVFCFTPKGRLIALPRGANPIDFAYAVHTDIGNTCVGAKLNGRPMPLGTELRNGDEVEIVCSKAQLPPSAWESSRRHRQGALGDPPRHPRCRSCAIRQARPRNPGQGLSAPGENLQREEPRRRPRPSVAKDRRGRHGRGWPGRACLRRRDPRGISRGEAARAAEAPAQGEAQRRRVVRTAQGHGPQISLAGIGRTGTRGRSERHPDQGHARRLAGELRPRRRGSRRPYRRYPHAEFRASPSIRSMPRR